MNVGDYYTNGKSVVHLQERTSRGDWIVLVWAKDDGKPIRILMFASNKTLTEYRKLTPAEVRQWVAGGPVPGRDEP